jgi:pyrroline-5-carboxylate reductase
MIGIIGFGKLGSAFAQGFSNRKIPVIAYDKSQEKISIPGILKAKSPKEVFERSEIIFLSLKPAVILDFLKENSKHTEGKLLVSPAAKTTLAELESSSPNSKFIRIMPNIAASENLSPIPYSKGKNISKEDEAMFLKLFSEAGNPIVVEEKHMPVVTAIVGSSPAYFAYFTRAMREAAKDEGVPEATAEQLIAESLAGTGALLKKNSPEKLIEIVSTKGGVTEKGLKELESAGVLTAIKHAIKFQSKK